MRLSVDEAAERSTIAPIRVFDDPEAPADPAGLARLHEGIEDSDLAAPPVVLPDFHQKEDMEMPSSIAIATRETIRPTFTGASVNCGMALIALDGDLPSRAGIDTFFRRVRECHPYPPSYRPALSRSDVLRCAEEGAAFAIGRGGLDAADLERIEHLGKVDTAPFGGPSRLRDELPWLSQQLGRLRFGSIGPTNHFLELQRVEEILDAPAARRLGVELGQTTLQYHAGGGVLTGQIGRLFASRTKASRPMRIQMTIQRPLHHLGSARSGSELRRRLSLFFSDRPVPASIHEPEGTRMLLANAAAMNYGFAFRAAIYGSLRSLARRHLGVNARLIVDSPHNSIYEEDVDGQPAIVHRHNACRAYPSSQLPPGSAFGDVGQALLLPGTHRTSSYLCVAGDRVADTLFSASHGAGTIIEGFERSARSRLHPGKHATLEFSYSAPEPVDVAHLDDRGVDTALRILSRNGIVRPVARLRPKAVLH
jgi:tRNA-splicing ligase RtcB